MSNKITIITTLDQVGVSDSKAHFAVGPCQPIASTLGLSVVADGDEARTL